TPSGKYCSESRAIRRSRPSARFAMRYAPWRPAADLPGQAREVPPPRIRVPDTGGEHTARTSRLVDVPRIAYFGPSGTFTEMALAEFESSGSFDGPVERIAAPSQAAALDLVRAGSAAAAVVPIESSVEGSISATLDSLALGPRLQIVAETELEVTFTILARPGTHIAAVRSLAAYPVALA